MVYLWFGFCKLFATFWRWNLALLCIQPFVIFKFHETIAWSIVMAFCFQDSLQLNWWILFLSQPFYAGTLMCHVSFKPHLSILTSSILYLNTGSLLWSKNMDVRMRPWEYTQRSPTCSEKFIHRNIRRVHCPILSAHCTYEFIIYLEWFLQFIKRNVKNFGFAENFNFLKQLSKGYKFENHKIRIYRIVQSRLCLYGIT